MRSVVMLAISTIFAITASAQYQRSGVGGFRSFTVPLGGRSGLGAPQTPGVGLNGLPSFSTRQYQFNCFGCRPVHNRRSTAVWPFFGGAVLPAYPLIPDQAPPLAYDPESMPVSAPPPSVGMEIHRLRSEVDELKQQREAERFAPPPEPAEQGAVAEPEEPPTIVILRDGRRLQVRNYAVMGRVFWDFSARPAKQVPIADIDVAASQRANEAQGIEFPHLQAPAKN